MKAPIIHIFTSIYTAMANILSQFFEDDFDVMSPDAKRILSNKEDAKKYIQAIGDLKTVDRVTITLSTGEEITLVNH